MVDRERGGGSLGLGDTVVIVERGVLESQRLEKRGKRRERERVEC